MMESGYYPPGAEFDPNAPYNQVEPEEIEVEVTVSVTLSKTFKITTTNYEVDEGRDENGYYRSLEYGDLTEDVEQQVTMPQDMGEFVRRSFINELALKNAGMSMAMRQAIEDSSNWNVDEMEIIVE